MHIPVANRLGKTKEYYFSKKLREITQMNEEPPKVINLGIGSPDRPPHPDVVKALHQTALKEDTHGYQSYKGSKELRTAFADWYKRLFDIPLNPDNEVLPLIGSKEGIMHLCMTFLNEGDEVLVPDPGYPTYSSASKLAGAKTIPYDLKEENNYQPNLKELAQSDLSKVKIMWLNYPHMPTGTQADPQLFEDLVAFAKEHKILLVHDNPYGFILRKNPQQTPNPLSIFNTPGAKEVAVELNSLSKSHNMAGWRVGVMTGDAAIIENVLRYKSNMDSGTFLGMQMAAVKALSLDKEWFTEVNQEYAKREEKAQELLDFLGCTYKEDQQGMFVWAKIPNQYKDGYELSDKVLYGARVFITPGGIFGKNGDPYVRISLCSTSETIQESIDRIKQLFNQENAS